MQRVIGVAVLFLLSVLAWMPTSAAESTELGNVGRLVGDYVPEHDGAILQVDGTWEIVSLVDGTVVAGPLPVGSWSYHDGRLLSCDLYGDVSVLDATSLDEILTTNVGLNIGSGLCVVVAGELFFVHHGPSGTHSVGAVNLATGAVRLDLFPVDGDPQMLLAHPGQPDRLYVEWRDPFTGSRSLTLLDTLVEPLGELASSGGGADLFFDGADEIVGLFGDLGVRIDASSLEEIARYENETYFGNVVPFADGRAVATSFNQQTRRSELHMVDVSNGRIMSTQELPESPRALSISSATGTVLAEISLGDWRSYSPKPFISNLTPDEAEVGFQESMTLEYWSLTDATELTIGGIPVPFELVERGIEFTPPALPVGSHNIEIAFNDGGSLDPGPGRVLRVVDGPERAEFTVQIDAAPGVSPAVSTVIDIACDGNGDEQDAMSVQTQVRAGDKIELAPVVGARCTVEQARATSRDPRPALFFGPIVDGRVIDVWVTEPPELVMSGTGNRWGAVIEDEPNRHPLWVGAFQTMAESKSRPVELDCPRAGRSQADVAFGDLHRFTVQSGFEGGGCVLRATPAPFALGTGIARVDLTTGDADPTYSGERVLAPITQNMTYFEVVDVYRHPLDDPYQFVIMLYRDLFGRRPDNQGLFFWGDRIDSGELRRSDVAESFIDSTEFGGSVAPVVRLYEAYFLRSPDVDGLRFWMTRVRAGQSLGSVSEFFAQSTEFDQRYGAATDAEFVDLVYENVLGRAPEAEGRAYWIAELGEGLTRGDMMIGFSESPENMQRTNATTVVTSVYVSLLGRLPEPGGLEYWSGQVDAGMSLTTLIEALLGSPEYEGRFPTARTAPDALSALRGKLDPEFGTASQSEPSIEFVKAP